MAILIDMAEEAERQLDPANTEVQILPSERECDEDFTPMTLVVLTTEPVMLRIHKCPACGLEKRYGGRSW